MVRVKEEVTEKQRSERREDAVLLTLKIEEASTSQGLQGPLEGKGQILPLEPPKEHGPANTLISAQ